MLDYLNGKTILVDKPFGWTSFDVVNKIRWNLKQKLGVKNIIMLTGDTKEKALKNIFHEAILFDRSTI